MKVIVMKNSTGPMYVVHDFNSYPHVTINILLATAFRSENQINKVMKLIKDTRYNFGLRGRKYYSILRDDAIKLDKDYHDVLNRQSYTELLNDYIDKNKILEL